MIANFIYVALKVAKKTVATNNINGNRNGVMLLNTSERITRFLEVRHTELKAFTGFDEIARMNKIQKHLFTAVACDFSINCGIHIYSEAAHTA